MNMMVMNAESLSVQLGREIPEVLVAICKNDIAGLSPADIAKLIGVGESEVVETQTGDDYRDLRVLLGAAAASAQVETDSSWDHVENLAVGKLAKYVQQSKDPEFLLKAAAVSNRAQRRLSPNKDRVLDPRNGEVRVPLKLTERLIMKMNAAGDIMKITERQISVLDGSAVNPSFATIDRALGVRNVNESVRDGSRMGEDFGWADLGLDPE